MATRKKSHKRKRVGTHKVKHHVKRRVSGRTTTRRRRKVSGANKVHDAILLGVGVIGGAVVTPFIVQALNTALGSNAATMPSWLIPSGGFATGMVGAIVGESMNNKLLLGGGLGMAAVGAVMAANEMGLSEPGISGTAFSNNAAPGATAATKSVGCRTVGSPQRFVNNSVGAMSRMEAQAIGALYSN